jgi:hypothetical protein
MISIRNGLEDAQTREIGDERLYEAMMLLNRPMKKRAPGYVPIIAVLGVISSGMFFTYTMTRLPVGRHITSPGAPSLASQHNSASMLSPLTVPAAAGHYADFELSANSGAIVANQGPVQIQDEVVPQFNVGPETVNLDN